MNGWLGRVFGRISPISLTRRFRLHEAGLSFETGSVSRVPRVEFG